MPAVPVYRKIINDIRERIESGGLKAGDKLPSISQLRDEFKVSYGSVRGAMLVLKAEKLVEGRQGDGVFVRDPKQKD